MLDSSCLLKCTSKTRYSTCRMCIFDGKKNAFVRFSLHPPFLCRRVHSHQSCCTAHKNPDSIAHASATTVQPLPATAQFGESVNRRLTQRINQDASRWRGPTFPLQNKYSAPSCFGATAHSNDDIAWIRALTVFESVLRADAVATVAVRFALDCAAV